jgi:hypothetical protein
MRFIGRCGSIGLAVSVCFLAMSFSMSVCYAYTVRGNRDDGKAMGVKQKLI